MKDAIATMRAGSEVLLNATLIVMAATSTMVIGIVGLELYNALTMISVMCVRRPFK